MHLCDIPEEAMNQLHIPNGVPLVYNVRGKCITLLEDKETDNQINIDDFGPAAKYLFKPCELDDDFFQSIERIDVKSSFTSTGNKRTDTKEESDRSNEEKTKIEFFFERDDENFALNGSKAAPDLTP
jgi:hypothetical protein